MKISDAADLVSLCVTNKQPVFVWGPPGIGKSAVIHQLAKKAKMSIIDIRAVLLDPVDVRGLPSINGDNRAHWCPPAFLPHDEDSAGVLFLDELPQAPPLTQSALLQLVLDRKIGEYQLPEGWTVVAAGNRQQDRTGSSRIIKSLDNRFAHVEVEVNADDWLEWARDAGIDATVRSFINFKRTALHQFNPDEESHAFPTPRSWEFASNLIKASVSEKGQAAAVAACVGAGHASEYFTHRKLHDKMPTVKEIMASPKKCPVPDQASIMCCVAESVIDIIKGDPQKVLDHVWQYVARWKSEHAFMVYAFVAKNHPRIAVDCPNFCTWSEKNIEKTKAAMAVK